MEIIVKQGNGLAEKADVLVVTVYEGVTKPTGFLKELDDVLGLQISGLIKRGVFSGKSDQLLQVHGIVDKHALSVILVGLGKQDGCDYVCLRQVAGNVSRAAAVLKGSVVAWHVDPALMLSLDAFKLGQSLVEGYVLGGYKFRAFKSDTEPSVSVKSLIFALDSAKGKADFTSGQRKGLILADSVNVARDLANTPPNVLTPARFVEEAKILFKKLSSVSIEVLDRKKALKLGMHAFLGVAQGSVEEPYLLVLRYENAKKQAPICFVGKGVTFDTGGISIKPSASMKDMKGDMAGAASVLAAMLAIAKLELKGNFMAVMPLVENMPSGSAQRPGDIVTAMNGKTIEIVNTDAEGRLILADALCYAVKEGASQLIDVATLTGACSVALGTAAAGMLGNSTEMMDRFREVSHFTGERVWQLPLFEDYLEQLKSDVADISHCYEGRDGGTCTAAKFLEQFVDEKPWVHLDIASVMMFKADKGFRVKGMAAEGVRNLIEYACNPASVK